MKHFLRPCRNVGWKLGVAALAAAGAWLAMAPPAAGAQVQDLAPILEDPSLLLANSGAAGYLGVDVTDIDAAKAQALKLKEVRGALITLIDHDAPAGQVGLRVNDVVLALNGQNVESAEQLRRMLREIPPGRKVSLEISRDGNIQTLAVELADRKAVEHAVWYKIGIETDGLTPPPPAMGILTGEGGVPMTGGFHMPLFGSTLKVGALVEPLTSQMAEYLGVQGGLMVKQVARKSEAAAAGFKVFDVILKVGADPIMTSADWERALRSNQGKPVQVTILRDKKQLTLTLQVDSKHRGAVEYPQHFPFGAESLLAESAPLLDPAFLRAFSAQAEADAEAAAEAARAQAGALRQRWGDLGLQISPEQMEQFRQQMEKLRESMKDFQGHSKEFEQQLRQQMEQFRKNFNQEQMKRLQQQMEQFQRQMEEWCAQRSGRFV